MGDLVAVGVVCIIVAAIPFLVINSFRAFSKKESARRFEQKPTELAFDDQNLTEQHLSIIYVWAGNVAYFVGGALSATIFSYLRYMTGGGGMSFARPSAVWTWMLTSEGARELANSGLVVLVIAAILAGCFHYRYGDWRITAKCFCLTSFVTSLLATFSNS